MEVVDDVRPFLMTNQNQYRNDDFDFEAVFRSLRHIEIKMRRKKSKNDFNS